MPKGACYSFCGDCCCSVTQSCPTVCDPMNCSTLYSVQQASLSFTISWSLFKLNIHWVSDAIQPSHPLSSLLFLPSMFHSIRVFSNELVLHNRWPNYWSLSFSISPSNKYSGLISFRIDWFDILTVQGILKNLLQHHSLKASILWCSDLFTVQIACSYMTTGKTIALYMDLCWQRDISAF